MLRTAAINNCNCYLMWFRDKRCLIIFRIMLIPCGILQESDNKIPANSLLIHPGAKMMIAFCPWERGPQHLGHAPPEKLVFLMHHSSLFPLILDVSPFCIEQGVIAVIVRWPAVHGQCACTPPVCNAVVNCTYKAIKGHKSHVSRGFNCSYSLIVGRWRSLASIGK